MQIARVNINGLDQIATALRLYHKIGKGYLTAGMLNAWATEAKESFYNGNGMCFEIPSWDSTTGRPEEVLITSDGYDIEILNDE